MRVAQVSFKSIRDTDAYYIRNKVSGILSSIFRENYALLILRSARVETKINEFHVDIGHRVRVYRDMANRRSSLNNLAIYDY